MSAPSPPIHRIVLVEPEDARREILAERLRIQGFEVEAFACPSRAALHALASPPSALVADLWMPSISGVQLCRLLRAEAATEAVPIILRGVEDTPRERFWADRAGASAYVAKGRVGELSRSLRRAIEAAPEHDGFFLVHPATLDIRDRIGRLLDQALFESLLAAELRALSTCEGFTRLFDLFSQVMCQIVSYRWLAVATGEEAAVHGHPAFNAQVEEEARAALGLPEGLHVARLEDEDALACGEGAAPLIRPLHFGGAEVGRLAVALCGGHRDQELVDLAARELGGPLRIVSLVQETQRLAARDPLTGLLNRRAFGDAAEQELERSMRLGTPLALILLDIDHFKRINDQHGHAGGDLALSAIGGFLKGALRSYDLTARWGGEEFVIALPQVALDDVHRIAERLRAGIEALHVNAAGGARIPTTASIGVATRREDEGLMALINRADMAMYAAKTGGRNRVVVDEATTLFSPRRAAG